MFARIAEVANATSVGYMSPIGNTTDVVPNITAIFVGGLQNTTTSTTESPDWAGIIQVNGVLAQEFLDDDEFSSGEVLYPVNKDSLMPMILILPLGGMLLFLSLIALVVLFRQHPAIVMAVAALSLLAAGAYNLGLVLWTSEESAYRTTFDPRAPPKYE